MPDFVTWSSAYFIPCFAILTATIGFTIYWFITQNKKIPRRFFGDLQSENNWAYYIFFQKVMGFVFMGLVPAILVIVVTDFSLFELGISFSNASTSGIYIVLMGLAIVLVNSFAARKPQSLATYPQMRIENWSGKRFAINAIGWGLYLFAYEFLFRGILLFMCYQYFGFWPAVAINLSLYSATHIPKGLGETIGAYPYGFFLCYITIKTGSIAVAFFTHWIMSLSSDYFSIRYNSKMRFV